MTKLRSVCVITLWLAVQSSSLFADSFAQINLVSDTTSFNGNPADPNLKDPWGISFSPTSPIWVSDRETGVTTLYRGNGANVQVMGNASIAVPPGTALTGPTGQVFAGSSPSFGANFIFATLGGTIDAWSGGASATSKVTTAGASYTGLALGNNLLFAANFVPGGGINIFNSSYAPTTVMGNLTDPNLPAGYAPYNVQNVNGNLYVEYAKVTPGTPVALPGGGGFVAVFDLNGNFLQQFKPSALDAPWGVAVVPASGFGSFGAGDVLIGNFGNGEINVFDSNGNPLGLLKDSNNNPFMNSGLWALAFDPGAPSSQNTSALYFTAGPNQGADGLFGAIDPIPEPGSWMLVPLGLIGLLALRYKRLMS